MSWAPFSNQVVIIIQSCDDFTEAVELRKAFVNTSAGGTMCFRTALDVSHAVVHTCDSFGMRDFNHWTLM